MTIAPTRTDSALHPQLPSCVVRCRPGRDRHVTESVVSGTTSVGVAASVDPVFEQARVVDAGALSDGELSDLGLHREPAPQGALRAEQRTEHQ